MSSKIEIIEPDAPKVRQFTHLHLHTTYSLLDGAQRIGRIDNPKKEYGVINRAKELGMTSVAMTDHGNMFGTVDFYKKARAADIKPILGCEVYMAPGARQDKAAVTRDGKRAFHFVILAQNEIGYKNLCKLVSKGYFEGFYYNPRIDKEILREHSEGLIGLSACLAGELAAHCMRNRLEEARETAKEFQEIFDGRYFIEMQMNGIEDQLRINPHLYEIANDLDIDVVATNDVHYISRADAEAQDVLMAIQMRKCMDDPNRLKHEVDEFYLKSAEEMYEQFKDYTIACDNTQKVADMCNVELPLDKHFFPVIDLPDKSLDNKQYLVQLSEEGMNKRLEVVFEENAPDTHEKLREDYAERLKYELEIIESMGFSDYFLIVADFINWAKDNGIPVGPGRGCLTGDTPVMMANGSHKSLQDIEVGDRVFSHTGQIRPVVDTMVYDVDETLLRIETYYGDNRGITMTQDHKVFAEKARLTQRYQSLPEKWKSKARKYLQPTGKVDEIPAEELEPGDWIYYPKLQTNVEIEEGFVFRLLGFQHTNFCETRLEGDVLVETIPTNESFMGSMRDISRNAGVSRNFLRNYLYRPSPEDKLTVRQKEAGEKVEHYLNSLGLTPCEWREKYNQYKEYKVSKDLVANEELMWVLGKWVADGWVNQTKRREVGFCFHSKEVEERARLERWLKEHHLFYKTYQHAEKQLVQVEVNSETLCNWILWAFPHYQYKSETKALPKFVDKLSEELLTALLQGYISGDGYCKGGRIKMTTVSSVLARQLKQTLLRLNIPSSLSRYVRNDKRTEYANSLPNYVLNCPALTPLVEEDCAQANYRYHRWDHGLMCQIKSVDTVEGIDKVYDITVEEDHSYMTYNGAVHNSAAGSLVAFAMRITDIDPIKHDLLFERFLNPERVSMPDIDVDFCEARREEVIEYVRQKYAVDDGPSVAQIITFGKLKAKAVIRDVGRAYGMSFGEVDKIAKLIPAVLDITLADALQQEPRIGKLMDSDPKIAKVIDIGQRLEGLNRHSSIHAAGVVISDGRSLEHHLPLYKGAKGEVVTQFDMNGVEAIGLIKFDFLGLKNLTLIANCLRIIEKTRGEVVDIDRVPLDAPKAFDLLCAGDTVGVFQLESSGMREVMKKLKPSVFDDVIALVALYRPGPLQGGVVDSFIDRKHGREKIEYVFAELEPILSNTYGVCIYQEQVMQIANVIASYSLGEADMLRRAMGKKKVEEMIKQRKRFLSGAEKNEFDVGKAEELFDILEQFAKYGFNKSHSAAYGFVAYQTAFLKAYYRCEYMAALFTADSGNSEKMLIYLNDCAKADILVLPPDVNESYKTFAVVDGNIRFGLAGVKNVGDGAIDSIIEERKENGPYTTFVDFCERIDYKKVNRRVVESLIKCGAFDSLGINRRSLFDVIEGAMQYGQVVQREKASAQISLFGGGGDGGGTDLSYEIAEISEWIDKVLLSYEKDALGFYISGHPLNRYRNDLENFVSGNISDLLERKSGGVVSLAGIVTSRKDMTTKRGDRMAFIGLEDLTGSIEVSLFPEAFRQAAPFLDAEVPLLIKGDLEVGDRSVKLLAKEVASLPEVRAERSREIHVKLTTPELEDGKLEKMLDALKQHEGHCTTFLHITIPDRSETVMRLPKEWNTHPTEELIEALERMFGENPTYLR